MIFTFLTITYNHEKMIIQHLESIKFQIENYGEKNKFQLIIADDYSKDRTIDLIKIWLSENACLFELIDILESETNQGVCKNFTNALKLIKGEQFKPLAGDDIYSSSNIFEAVKLLEKFDIVCTPIVEFSKFDIFNNKSFLKKFIDLNMFCNMDYQFIRKNYIQNPLSVGIFINKKLINGNVINFINKYRFLEDYSMQVKLYEENKHLKIKYYEEVLVLYRCHKHSITRTKNKNTKNILYQDDINLARYQINMSNSILFKFKKRFYILRIKMRMKNDFLLYISKIMNIGSVIKKSFIFNKYKYHLKANQLMENTVFLNSEYIRKIVVASEKYESQ